MTASLLIDDPTLRRDIEYLLEKDIFFSRFDVVPDNIIWPRYPKGAEGLVRIIQAQQIAFKTAETLWLKTQDYLKGQPVIVLAQAPSKDLKSLGFSRQKQNYLHYLFAILNKVPDFIEKLEAARNEQAIQQLIMLKGFGTWSAQIYLLMAATRRNIFVQDDLVIRKAIHHFKIKNNIVKGWDGFYSAATLLLWHLYIHKLKTV